MASSDLVSPRRMTGPELSDMLDHYWPNMRRTRDAAETERRLMAGELSGAIHENFKVAGADNYRSEIPHIFTVPQRVRQNVVKSRPQLKIPLGPKGLGITSQRLTTRVEQPLNAICEHPTNGFRWEDMADIVLFEGWGAGITVTDWSDWRSGPQMYEKGREKEGVWQKRYRVDSRGRGEDDDEYAGEVDDGKAAKLYQADLDHHRACHLPIRHRALSISDCAPIFGPDMSVEGLIVTQDFSVSQLRRKYRFGDIGLPSPTGTNSQGENGLGTWSSSGQTLTEIEAWLIDEDGLPYVSYCLKGPNGPIEARWKAKRAGAEYDNEIATIDLSKRYGIDRLPIAWEWGLSFSTRNPDYRALPFTRPFRQGWLNVNANLTSINAHLMWRGFPGLLVKQKLGLNAGTLDDGQEPDVPEIGPMKITYLSDAEEVTEIATQGIDDAVFKAIEIQLGANDAEGPGKRGGDQSGFAMSLAEAFEAQALTTVHESLGRLYEAHGSFVLESGKRIPEKLKLDPIMVFRSTDVPTGESRKNDGPMELDPDLIDETYTTVATYTKEMSIPERQQSAEMVERRLKTRRKHLEDDGDPAPETTELELLAEDQRSEPAYKQMLAGLVTQIQGAEEQQEIQEAMRQGLANPDGMASALAQGVMPPGMMPGMPPMQGLPPGFAPPPMPGQLGVPEGGSLTGFGGPTAGQAALAGTVGGAGMQGPINNAVENGGVLPDNLGQPLSPV